MSPSDPEKRDLQNSIDEKYGENSNIAEACPTPCVPGLFCFHAQTIIPIKTRINSLLQVQIRDDR